jgi:hypothetical protein
VKERHKKRKNDRNREGIQKETRQKTKRRKNF